jgi:hypothetical protein
VAAITHTIGPKTHAHSAIFGRSRHPAQELVIAFILVGLEVEIAGDLTHALIADPFHMRPHEPVVCLPGHSRGTHGRLLGSRRDLVRMEIAQAEVIHQCLFHRLMQYEKAIDLDLAPPKPEQLRHVPIDVDRLAILAVAGEIRMSWRRSTFLIWRTTASSARFIMKPERCHSGTRSFFETTRFDGIDLLP